MCLRCQTLITNIDQDRVSEKLDLAQNRMYCNYAFYFGATADNASELADLVDLEGCCELNCLLDHQQETF